MTTYNTGNPVGSSDPRDLYDNAENFDQAVNSESTTFNDRLGRKRLTLKGFELAATGVPAVQASIDAALSSQEAELFANQAEEAALSIQPDVKAYALISGEENAVAADFGQNYEKGAVKKYHDNIETFSGKVHEFFPEIFNAPKMVTKSDGSIGWADHNLVGPSNNLLSSAWLKAGAVTGGQFDSEGGTEAWLLESTSATACHVRRIVSINDFRYYTASFIVRAGSSDFCYIRLASGTDFYAYFNLTNATVGTVTAGGVANISNQRPDGSTLPDGYYWISLSVKAGTSMTQYIGISDADGAITTTIGKTLIVEKPLGNYGNKPLNYIETTGTGGRQGTPYDWSLGDRKLLLEPSTTAYNSRYGDDLAQPEWVKTGISAALDASGPHGEPCSTLTATVAGGTCLQSITSAESTQMFSAFVRRKTGVGPVSITTDGGTTWTDISGELNNSDYVRVSASGTANPTVGFKIDVSGDEIEVALAINAREAFLTSPMPIYSEDGVRGADVFDYLLSDLGSSENYSVFLDFMVPKVSDPAGSYVGLRNSGSTEYCRVTSTPTTTSNYFKTYFIAKDASGNQFHNIFDPDPQERMEVSLQVSANAHAVSVNGEPTGYVPTIGMPSVDRLSIGATTLPPFHLNRLLVTTRKVGVDNLRAWRWSGSSSGVLLNARVVNEYGATAGTETQREPVLCILDEDGTTADIAVFHMQKSANNYHPEAPARVVQRNYRFDSRDNSLEPITATSVIKQPSRWNDGLGHIQSPNLFVVPSGINKGRIIMFFSQQDSVSGTFTDDDRNIYVMVNDRGGDPDGWSNPSLVVDASVLGLSVVVMDPCGSGVILPSDHPVAPDRVVATFYTNGSFYTLYSDTFGGANGDQWTIAGPFTVASAPSINETNLSYWPDGTIVATHRAGGESVSDMRPWSKSTDGGVTFADQGLLPNFSGAPCSAGIAQLDKTGVTGDQGKIAISHPIARGSQARNGTLIDFANDPTMALGETLYPWTTNRYMGYSSIKPLFGGSRMAVGVEGGSLLNLDESIYLSILDTEYLG